MRKLVLSTVSLFALAAVPGAALSADIPRAAPEPYQEPALVPAAHNWTGFYAGVLAGYGWGQSRWAGEGRADPDGVMLGGTLGYNWQGAGSPWVLGIEGDIAWSNMRGGSFASVGCPFRCETRNNWFGTVRGRVGYSFDTFMPYVTGGLAVGDVRAERGGIASTNTTRAGWTVGGGLEAALAPAWTAKIEYLYADLGSVSNLGTDVDFKSHIVRAGLNFRF